MATGSHVRPKSNKPRSDSQQDVPEIEAIDEDYDDTGEIDEPWLYCSVPEFMRYLEKREAEIVEQRKHDEQRVDITV